MNKSFIRKNQEKNLSCDKEVILSELQGFRGTTQYHRYSPQQFPDFVLTDGAHYLAERCEAYWLMDVIASWQQSKKIKNHEKLRELQFWSLAVNNDAGIVRCEWDEGKTVIEQAIEYTDFPLDSAHVWVRSFFPTKESVKAAMPWMVAMLPSEY